MGELQEFVELANRFNIVFIGDKNYQEFEKLYQELKDRYDVASKHTDAQKLKLKELNEKLGWSK